MKTAIIGLGLIGGSMALDLRKSGLSKSIVGVDTNPTHAEQAVALGLVDGVVSFEEAIDEADLIIAAIPVNALVRILPNILDRISDHAVVMDIGSTKGMI